MSLGCSVHISMKCVRTTSESKLFTDFMQQTTSIDFANIQTITEQLYIAIFCANGAQKNESDWCLRRNHANRRQHSDTSISRRMKRFVCTQTLCVFYFYWARLRILAWIESAVFCLFSICFFFQMCFFLFIQIKWNGVVCMCSIIVWPLWDVVPFSSTIPCKTQRKIFIRSKSMLTQKAWQKSAARTNNTMFISHIVLLLRTIFWPHALHSW